MNLKQTEQRANQHFQLFFNALSKKDKNTNQPTFESPHLNLQPQHSQPQPSKSDQEDYLFFQDDDPKQKSDKEHKEEQKDIVMDLNSKPKRKLRKMRSDKNLDPEDQNYQTQLKYQSKSYSEGDALDSISSMSYDISEQQQVNNTEGNKRKQRNSKKSPQSELDEESLPRKKKKNYSKETNSGNTISEKAKIQYFFRKLCTPEKLITFNSLGHTLTKFKINFKVEDVKDMLEMYQKMIETQDKSKKSSKTDHANELNTVSGNLSREELTDENCQKLTLEQFRDLFYAISVSRKK